MAISSWLGLGAAAALVLASFGVRALDATRLDATRLDGARLAPAPEAIRMEPVKAGSAVAAKPAGKERKPTSFKTPAEAFQVGTKAYYAGDKSAAYAALEAAAASGHPLAQWKLGRMYAEGDGVAEDRLKAFQYFSRIADQHADDSPYSPQARFVANAFVALGTYYRDGIPNSDIKPDIERAVNLFTYAASYFGDADAQFELGRLYLEGEGVGKDVTRAARWLTLAARKNHHGAQATLGNLLFRGEGELRHPTQGLMWLELARRGAQGAEDNWILVLHEHAFADASKAERDRALEIADRYAQRFAKEDAEASAQSAPEGGTAAPAK